MDHPDRRENTRPDGNSSHSARLIADRYGLLLEASKEMPNIAEIGVYDEPA